MGIDHQTSFVVSGSHTSVADVAGRPVHDDRVARKWGHGSRWIGYGCVSGRVRAPCFDPGPHAATLIDEEQT